MGYRLLLAAEADIESIALYIAADDFDAALRWVADIERRCALWATCLAWGLLDPICACCLRATT